MRGLLVLLVFLNASMAFSLNAVQKIINGLRYLPESSLESMSKDLGELCEFAAAEFVALKYPSDGFYILRNLTYSKNRKRQLGELDIMVFSKRTNLAVHLYEVKCRNDEEDAYEKSLEQLFRFKNNIARCIRNPYKSTIKITDGHEYFDCSRFTELSYDVLMPKNNKSQPSPALHFDLDLAEIHSLQVYLRSMVN